MAPNVRVKAAFQAMKSIGIPEQKTKPALKKLLKLFDKNWDLIEEENYRVLADAIFEYEDTEVAEKEKKGPETADVIQREPVEEESQMQDEPERPLKRLRLKHQNQATPSNVQPNSSSGIALKIPKPEPGLEEALPSQQAQPAIGSPHVAPQQLRNKGKQPISSQNVGVTAGRPHPSGPVHGRDKRASQALQIKEPKADPRVPTGKNKQSNAATLIKVKDEPFTDDMTSLEPLAVVVPERVPPEACSNITTPPIDRQDGQQAGVYKSAEGIDKGAGTMASPTVEENHMKETDVPAITPVSIEIAASSLGEVKVCLSCSPGPSSHDFHVPDLQTVCKKVEDDCIKTYKIMNPKFTVKKVMSDLCECVLELRSDGNYLVPGRSCPDISSSMNGDADISDNVAAPTKIADKITDNLCAAMDVHSSVNVDMKSSIVQEQHQLNHDGIGCVYDMADITRGQEGIKVSLEKSNSEFLPSFQYIAQNVIFDNADVKFSLTQFGDQTCCLSCRGDCFAQATPCKCAQRNEGEIPYTHERHLREEFLEECISMVRNPKNHLTYCKDCPLERLKNEDMLDPCKGHLKRKFVKECWIKCGCNVTCGNRVVQRGIRCNLQVFWTPEGKGWGLRTLEDLPKGAFVCEYVGEILTTTELHKRNLRRNNDKHSYSVVLDTDWGLRALKDKEVLCLDAAFYGNVARFINHRCADANLIDIPVEVETPKHHYYRVALFTTRKIDANEELTWDYGVDFDDNEHHIKAFRCLCGSQFCRNMKRSSRSRSNLTLR